MDDGRSRARLWPALLACIGILPLFLATSILVGALAGIAYAVATGTTDRHAVESWYLAFSETVPGLLVLMLPVQALLVVGPLAAAALSPVPWRERLALRPPRLGPASFLLVLLGSIGVLLAVQVAGDLLIDEPSEVLQWFTRVITRHEGAAAFVVTAFLSLGPGFAEELFFRGYVQTRLAERWPAWAAIGVTSLSFAILHFDLQHSPLVLPMGVWLGFLAWATGSVWPSMLGHATINAVSIVLTRRFGDPESGELPSGPATYAASAAFLLATAACVVHLLHRRRHARPAAPSALE